MPKQRKTADKSNVKKLAREFLVYGALAEIFARETGFNKGLGGSMHAFFTPFGIYPNNAIVGGSATIALGSALYKRANKKPGIVVCNIGDASMGCGPVWEAMMMSVMDQIKQLWDSEHNKGLPLIFNFFNNNFGMGGQTAARLWVMTSSHAPAPELPPTRCMRRESTATIRLR